MTKRKRIQKWVDAFVLLGLIGMSTVLVVSETQFGCQFVGGEWVASGRLIYGCGFGRNYDAGRLCMSRKDCVGNCRRWIQGDAQSVAEPGECQSHMIIVDVLPFWSAD